MLRWLLRWVWLKLAELYVATAMRLYRRAGYPQTVVMVCTEASYTHWLQVLVPGAVTAQEAMQALYIVKRGSPTFAYEVASALTLVRGEDAITPVDGKRIRLQ